MHRPTTKVYEVDYFVLRTLLSSLVSLNIWVVLLPWYLSSQHKDSWKQKILFEILTNSINRQLIWISIREKAKEEEARLSRRNNTSG